MSWLFSQALVEEYSEANSWDGELSALLNVMPTPHKFWRKDKMMEFCNLSQFGLTCAVLTESRGAELLTWFLAGFPARTLVQPEREQELPEKEAAFGNRWQELSVRFDRNSCSWKTHQCLFQEDLQQSSVTLPQWGMMQDGVCLALLTPNCRRLEKDCSLLPAPTACDWKERGSIIRMANIWTNKNYKSQKRPVHYYSHYYKDLMPPTFNECLMGWPIEWTSLEPLAMDKFQQWQQQHGGFFHD